MESKRLLSNLGASVEGPLLLEPQIFYDERGVFYESWNQQAFDCILGKSVSFVQDNRSCSKLGVIRGLHYQLEPEAQGKLVSCFKGTVFDVIVDLRLSSKTFSQWIGVELSEKNCSQLWVPPGFAHGLIALSDVAEVFYKVTNFWSCSLERSLLWNDPDLAIEWPWCGVAPVLSEKDSKALSFSEAFSSNQVFV